MNFFTNKVKGIKGIVNRLPVVLKYSVFTISGIIIGLAGLAAANPGGIIYEKPNNTDSGVQQTQNENDESNTDENGTTASSDNQETANSTNNQNNSSSQNSQGNSSGVVAQPVLKVKIQGDWYGPVTNQQLITFYYEPIARLVPVNTYGISSQHQVLGETIHISYESGNCTGTPYLFYSDETAYKNKIYNYLLSAGWNSRWIAKSDSIPKAITENSQSAFDYGSGQWSCNVGVNTRTVIPIYQAGLPITDPVTDTFVFEYR